MTDTGRPEAARRAPPDIERITGPHGEARLIISELFKVSMDITSEMRKAFLEDPARFMASFFEQRGHKVNAFDVTVSADRRMRNVVTATNDDVQVEAIVVHVVQGDEIHEASKYI